MYHPCSKFMRKAKIGADLRAGAESRSAREKIPDATKKRRIHAQNIICPHKKRFLGFARSRMTFASGFYLGRPRAEAHGWGKVARICTESSRLAHPAPFLPPQNPSNLKELSVNLASKPGTRAFHPR
jgi:hypothetical protein